MRAIYIIAVLGAGGAALLLVPADQKILGFWHGQFVTLLFGAAIGVPLLVSVMRRFRGQFGRAFVSASVWLAILLGLVGVYSFRYEAQDFGERILSELAPGRVSPGGSAGEAVVRKRLNGHFVVDVEIGGARAPFLFDTGASSVVLRAEDAARFGIDVARLSFTIPVSTANGGTLCAETNVPRVSVGAISARNVRVLVARAGALQENLLGMSFLEKLASYTVENNRLVLRGR